MADLTLLPDAVQRGEPDASDVLLARDGLTLDQAAEVLDIPVATAKRDWTYARTWLYRAISNP